MHPTKKKLFSGSLAAPAAFTGILDGLPPALDMQPEAGITLNGDDASAWLSSEGNLYNYANGTASEQPTYNGVTVNGQQALNFDATAVQKLTGDTGGEPTFAPGTGGFYTIMLAQASSGSARAVWWNGVAGQFILYAISPLTGAIPAIILGSVTLEFPSHTLIGSTHYIYEYWRDGTDVRCRINGALDTDSKTSSANITQSPGASVIGNISGPHPYSGDLGRLLLYDFLPTLSSRNSALTWFSNKYGISI